MTSRSSTKTDSVLRDKKKSRSKSSERSIVSQRSNSGSGKTDDRQISSSPTSEGTASPGLTVETELMTASLISERNAGAREEVKTTRPGGSEDTLKATNSSTSDRKDDVFRQDALNELVLSTVIRGGVEPKLRWFILCPQYLRGYRKRPYDEKSLSKPKHRIPLKNIVVIERTNMQRFRATDVLQLVYVMSADKTHVRYKTIYIQTKDTSQLHDWLFALRDACVEANAKMASKYHPGVWTNRRSTGYSCCGESSPIGCMDTTVTISFRSSSLRTSSAIFDRKTSQRKLNSQNSEPQTPQTRGPMRSLSADDVITTPTDWSYPSFQKYEEDNDSSDFLQRYGFTKSAPHEICETPESPREQNSHRQILDPPPKPTRGSSLVTDFSNNTDSRNQKPAEYTNEYSINAKGEIPRHLVTASKSSSKTTRYENKRGTLDSSIQDGFTGDDKERHRKPAAILVSGLRAPATADNKENQQDAKNQKTAISPAEVEIHGDGYNKREQPTATSRQSTREPSCGDYLHEKDGVPQYYIDDPIPVDATYEEYDVQPVFEKSETKDNERSGIKEYQPTSGDGHRDISLDKTGQSSHYSTITTSMLSSRTSDYDTKGYYGSSRSRGSGDDFDSSFVESSYIHVESPRPPTVDIKDQSERVDIFFPRSTGYEVRQLSTIATTTQTATTDATATITSTTTATAATGTACTTKPTTPGTTSLLARYSHYAIGQSADNNTSTPSPVSPSQVPPSQASLSQVSPTSLLNVEKQQIETESYQKVSETENAGDSYFVKPVIVSYTKISTFGNKDIPPTSAQDSGGSLPNGLEKKLHSSVVSSSGSVQEVEEHKQEIPVLSQANSSLHGNQEFTPLSSKSFTVEKHRYIRLESIKEQSQTMPEPEETVGLNAEEEVQPAKPTDSKSLLVHNSESEHRKTFTETMSRPSPTVSIDVCHNAKEKSRSGESALECVDLDHKSKLHETAPEHADLDNKADLGVVLEERASLVEHILLAELTRQESRVIQAGILSDASSHQHYDENKTKFETVTASLDCDAASKESTCHGSISSDSHERLQERDYVSQKDSAGTGPNSRAPHSSATVDVVTDTIVLTMVKETDEKEEEQDVNADAASTTSANTDFSSNEYTKKFNENASELFSSNTDVHNSSSGVLQPVTRKQIIPIHLASTRSLTDSSPSISGDDGDMEDREIHQRKGGRGGVGGWREGIRGEDGVDMYSDISDDERASISSFEMLITGKEAEEAVLGYQRGRGEPLPKEPSGGNEPPVRNEPSGLKEQDGTWTVESAGAGRHSHPHGEGKHRREKDKKSGRNEPEEPTPYFDPDATEIFTLRVQRYILLKMDSFRFDGFCVRNVTFESMRAEFDYTVDEDRHFTENHISSTFKRLLNLPTTYTTPERMAFVRNGLAEYLGPQSAV